MIQINKDQCIGCGKCIKECVSQLIRLENNKAVVTQQCFLCGHCVAVCPAGAVTNPDYGMDEVEACLPDTQAFSLSPETLLRAIKFRRSVRDYRPEPVKEDLLNMLLQAGRYTATAKNNQDCHFIFVQQELPALKKYVWDSIDQIGASGISKIPKEQLPYVIFNRRRRQDPADDYLFRNAPVVLYITSEYDLDAGLAAQNMELMAASLGLGVLYNGYLARISDSNQELKAWLGIPDRTIKACMLLGHPNVTYARTAPRKEANVIWK